MNENRVVTDLSPTGRGNQPVPADRDCSCAGWRPTPTGTPAAAQAPDTIERA